MKHLLILGSLPKDAEAKALYETMINTCSPFAEEISTPIDTAAFQGTETERFERALAKVRAADLIIGEQTKPSTGQGIEIGHAVTFNKPILVVAQKHAVISGLIEGCPLVETIIYYTSPENLKEQLASVLKERTVD